MKRNEVLGEHKKGTKAVKYNKKPQDHSATYAKAKEKLAPQKPLEEAVEDRTSYQVAKILFDNGVKYDPSREDELINVIGMALVKKLDMSPKQARHLISYDEDFLSDTMGELRHMEQGVAEGRWDRRDSYQRDYDSSQTGFSRGHDHRGLEQELAHETNNYAVAIDGRTWKVFASKSHAEAVARSLQNKGKKATVHETGAEVSEMTGGEVGKITKVDPATKKATLTKADGSSMEVDSTALKPTPDGKMQMDAPDMDELKTGTSVVSTENSVITELDPPPNDSSSPIPGDNDHDEISKLLVHRLKRLAGLR